MAQMIKKANRGERKTLRRGRRRFLRGTTFIDSLIGTLIMVVSVIGMVNLVAFLMNMTEKNTVSTVVYNLGRSTIETVRNKGFPLYTNGTQTLYYDAYGNGEATLPAANSAYKVIINVTTSAWMSSASGSKPAPTATRTVTVTINRYPTNTNVLKWGTLLVRGGI